MVFAAFGGPRRAIDFLQQRQQCDRAFAVRSTMTHSGQPRMNIRRCVLGAFLRDLSQALQFFEGVESFGFVSLIAREDLAKTSAARSWANRRDGIFGNDSPCAELQLGSTARLFCDIFDSLN